MVPASGMVSLRSISGLSDTDLHKLASKQMQRLEKNIWKELVEEIIIRMHLIAFTGTSTCTQGHFYLKDACPALQWISGAGGARDGAVAACVDAGGGVHARAHDVVGGAKWLASGAGVVADSIAIAAAASGRKAEEAPQQSSSWSWAVSGISAGVLQHGPE